MEAGKIGAEALCALLLGVTLTACSASGPQGCFIETEMVAEVVNAATGHDDHSATVDDELEKDDLCVYILTRDGSSEAERRVSIARDDSVNKDAFNERVEEWGSDSSTDRYVVEHAGVHIVVDKSVGAGVFLDGHYWWTTYSVWKNGSKRGSGNDGRYAVYMAKFLASTNLGAETEDFDLSTLAE